MLALLCLSLCGCSWRDAGDLSAVTAGAVARDGGRYTLTAELAVPSADSAVPDARTLSGTADSLAQAIDRAGAGRDTQLYWSHARVLLLDTALTRDGIEDAVRALTVSSEVRPSVRVCAVSGCAAEEVLTEGGSLSGDPAGFALGDSMDLAVRQSRAADMPLYRVLDRVLADGIDPVLPAVSLEDGQAVLSGTALFSGDRLCGWLDETQTAALCILLHAGDTATVYDGDMRHKLSDLSASVRADAGEGGTPAFAVDVRADVACESDGQARRAAAALRAQCVQAVETLRRTGCDALGFGRAWRQADAASYGSAADGAWRSVPVTVRVALRGTQSAEGGSE